mgnify:CR=1 FL=1
MNQLNTKQMDSQFNNMHSKAHYSTKVDGILRIKKILQSEIRMLKFGLMRLNFTSSKVIQKNTSTAISDGNYYVVVQACRNEKNAKASLNKWNKDVEVQLVKNDRNNWLFVILKESFTMTEASRMVDKMKQSGRADAWWTTGRKLIH